MLSGELADFWLYALAYLHPQKARRRPGDPKCQLRASSGPAKSTSPMTLMTVLDNFELRISGYRYRVLQMIFLIGFLDPSAPNTYADNPDTPNLRHLKNPKP